MPGDDDVGAFGRPPMFVYVVNWDLWQSAVMAFDDRNDGAQLVALLQSDETIKSSARALLVDLLDRRRLKPGSQLPADTLLVLTKALKEGRMEPARELFEKLVRFG